MVGQKELSRAAGKGHSVMEWEENTSYEIDKAIIQEVGELSNTTEQRRVLIGKRSPKTRYQTGQKGIQCSQNMETNWRIITQFAFRTSIGCSDANWNRMSRRNHFLLCSSIKRKHSIEK